MHTTDRWTPEAEETQVWAHVLSLTGALLSQVAMHPQAQRFVAELLSSGLSRPEEPLDEPFVEPLSGLHTREIRSAEVLQHFFGV